MDFYLAPHVSYGLVGGRAVVLDLVADRYLRLGASETATLAGLANGSLRVSPSDARKLLDRGIVQTGTGQKITPVKPLPPVASALESDTAGGGISASEVLGWSIAALFALRGLGLARTVARWQAMKRRSERQRALLVEDLDRAAYFARGFAEARIAVPMPRLCVPDSLALASRLWKQGLAADVYFGIQLDPLLAHAWVQTGPLVLSDPLNIVADYSPVFRL